MAITKIYDLAVKTGEYQSEGKTKGRYVNVGAVMQNDEGGKFIFISKWFSPAGVPDLSGKGGESVILSMFEPKGNDSATAPAPTSNGGDDGDIPF